MSAYPNEPNPDDLIVTSAGGGDPYDVDAVQVFAPKHFGAINSPPFDRADRSTVQIGSAHCNGCGERQTELMLIGPHGKALYVKLRPSMAIKLGELLMLHGKAGQIQQ